MSSDEECDRQLSAAHREVVFAVHGRECQWCGDTEDEDDVQLEIHHKQPRADGGTDALDNLIPVCEECHHHHHSRVQSDDIDVDTGSVDLDLTPADHKLLDAIDRHGSAPVSTLASEAGISTQHAHRRLLALAGANLVAQSADKHWDYVENVDNPVGGRLPEDPERAARWVRDDIMRRMADAGLSYARIAEIVGLSDRTVPVAINRARAFDPPLPEGIGSDEDPTLSDLAAQISELTRRVSALETEY